MAIDMVPTSATVSPKIEQRNDYDCQLAVVENVKVAMENCRMKAEVLPYEDKLEVQIKPPASDEQKLQAAGKRPGTTIAMRQDRKRHHDGDHVQRQQHVSRAGKRNWRVTNHFVIQPDAVNARPHGYGQCHQQPESPHMSFRFRHIAEYAGQYQQHDAELKYIGRASQGGAPKQT